MGNKKSSQFHPLLRNTITDNFLVSQSNTWGVTIPAYLTIYGPL